MHYELFCTFAAKKLKLKRILSIILLFCALSIAAQPKYEVRAVWLTTLGGLDWPKSYAHDGMGIQRQQEDLCHILDQLQAINVNTVLFQTRVRATTAYPSELEPWEGSLSGVPGKTPGWDPLQFAIDECHRRGMELHAWVVAIPIGKWNTIGCKTMRKWYPSLVKRIGHGRLYRQYLRGDYHALRYRRHPSGLHPLSGNVERTQISREHHAYCT